MALFKGTCFGAQNDRYRCFHGCPMLFFFISFWSLVTHGARTLIFVALGPYLFTLYRKSEKDED
jgi:hypothetical protein